MQTVVERVAYMEGQVNEQSNSLVEVRNAVRHLEQRMETRMGGLEAEMSSRFTALDEKLSRYFVWTVGVQVTTFLAITAAITAAILAR
jgi:hypothetical protein